MQKLLNTDDSIIKLMWQAAGSRLGVEILTNDPEGFRRKFYSLRKKMKDKGFNEFDALTCITSPSNPANSIWLVKENPNGEEKRTPKETLDPPV